MPAIPDLPLADVINGTDKIPLSQNGVTRWASVDALIAGMDIGGLGYAPLNKAGDTMTGALHMGAHAIDGSAIAFTGGTLNAVAIGGSTPAAGAFTTLAASGAVTLTGAGTSLAVTNNVTIGGTLVVTGTITGAGSFSSATIASLTLTGAGTALTVNNNATVGGTLGVTGALTLAAGGAFTGTFSGAHTYSGVLSLTSGGVALAVTNSVTVGGSLVVTGGTTLSAGGAFSGTISGAHTYSGALSLTAAGTSLAVSNTTQTKTLSVQPGTITWSGTTTSGAAFNPFYMTSASHTGTSTATAEIFLNLTNVGNDSIIAASADKVVGWKMNHNVASGAVGTRNGFQYQLATTAAVSLDFLTACNFFAIGAHNMGGSAATFAGAKGQVFGGNSYARVDSGATYSREAVGWEFDVSVRDSTGTFAKVGAQVVFDGSDDYDGLSSSAGYVVSSQATARGIRNAYQVSAHGSYWPINQTPAFATALFRVFASQDYNTVAQGVNRGVDLLEATISDVAFRSQGFAVNGSGTVQVGTGILQAIAGGLQISAPGSLGTGTPTVSAGGSNYTVGDILYNIYGGVYRVATLSGSAVATVTVFRQAYVPGATPGNPVATTTWQVSTHGTGCTLTLAWTAGGNVTLGTASALATSATTGFALWPTMAGTPSGTVGAAGAAAAVIDTNTGRLMYSTGSGTWQQTGPKLLYSTGTNVGNTAATTEDTLQSYTIPANTLRNVGDRVRIIVSGSLGATTDTKIMRVKVGGSNLVVPQASTTAATAWRAQLDLIKTGASTQATMGYGNALNSAVHVVSSNTTFTDTSTIALLITGQNTTNSVADSVTCRYVTVEYLPA